MASSSTKITSEHRVVPPQMRRHPRIEVNLPVSFLGRTEVDATPAQPATAAKQARLVNVARGGVFVGTTETTTPPAVGSQVTLQFRAMATHLCEATGHVVWASGQPDRRGFGVQFDSTNLAMDVFTRSLSKLPAKMHKAVLDNVDSPKLIVN